MSSRVSTGEHQAVADATTAVQETKPHGAGARCLSGHQKSQRCQTLPRHACTRLRRSGPDGEVDRCGRRSGVGEDSKSAYHHHTTAHGARNDGARPRPRVGPSASITPSPGSGRSSAAAWPAAVSVQRTSAVKKGS
jgi:hypothetical protein